MSPALFAVLIINVSEATTCVVALEFHTLWVNDGRVLEIWLHAVLEFGRYNVHVDRSIGKKTASLFGVDQDKRAATVVLVEIWIGLLPAPEVSNGDVTWPTCVGEVALAARVTEEYVLVE